MKQLNLSKEELKQYHGGGSGGFWGAVTSIAKDGWNHGDQIKSGYKKGYKGKTGYEGIDDF